MTKKKQSAPKAEPIIMENGTLIVYAYNQNTGEFVGTDTAFPDPLTPGNFLIPAGATQVAPPPFLAGHITKYVNGEWVQEEVVKPIPTPIQPNSEDELALIARRERNIKLAESDWTQLTDVPSWVASNLEDWQTYRQALRDVPQQEEFPTTINWPEKP